MCMHAALLVECLDDFAGGDSPRVLLGDFNIKPGDAAYDLITTGQLDEEMQVCQVSRVPFLPRLRSRHAGRRKCHCVDCCAFNCLLSPAWLAGSGRVGLEDLLVPHTPTKPTC